MSVSVFAIVLIAAALHATWNAIVKGSGDKLLTTITVAGSAALLAALAIPFLTQPAVVSWPYVAGSVVLQIGYFVLVARVYHVADMSQAYPVMRGIAPLLVAAVGALWLGEHLTPTAWIGIGAICLGVLSMAFESFGDSSAAGTALALLNASVIAGYTLVDGTGVRMSGAPVAYIMWGVLVTGTSLVGWALVARRSSFLRNARRFGYLGLLGGGATLASYGSALWAMTVAPVAVIAGLRETSILFGTAIAGLILKESVRPARIVAACVIAAGAVVLCVA